MLIIGCDYHPGFQQIAFVDTDTGEAARTATDSPRRSRAVLQGRSRRRKVRVGMEASGHAAGLSVC